MGHFIASLHPHKTTANKTGAGNDSYGICRVINASRSPFLIRNVRRLKPRCDFPLVKATNQNTTMSYTNTSKSGYTTICFAERPSATKCGRLNVKLRIPKYFAAVFTLLVALFCVGPLAFAQDLPKLSEVPITKSELNELLVGDWTCTIMHDGKDPIMDWKYTFKTDRTYDTVATKALKGVVDSIILSLFSAAGFGEAHGSWIIVEQDGKLFLVTTLKKVNGDWNAELALKLINSDGKAGNKFRVLRTGPNDLLFYRGDTLAEKLHRDGPSLGK